MSRVLITSALPYINGVKHLGNLIGSMLPADVYARFLRARGDDVLYICATDEHGTPAELAAAQSNMSVTDFCQEQHERQRDIYAAFNISFDHFGRSSSRRNVEMTQEIYQALDRNGFIDEQLIEQVYSIADGRFLPDRYIVGTCPKCGYTAARGDQCENCTTVLDPTDLIEPRSAISGSSDLVVRGTKHLFLRLEALESEVNEWVQSRSDWPQLVQGIANKWIREGLRDRGITRDLSWGVPVPRAGLEEKVFYVWFDAPIAYIAATREWADVDPAERDWQSWWCDADEVKYVQFMAKDNVPFHAIFFPAMLLGTRQPWKQVDYIKGFNWLTFYGGKFSTSQQRGIFTDQALEEFEADYWRYWLVANAPESSDSSFTFQAFADMTNADLNDNLGNFVSRVLKLTAKKFGDQIPEGGEWGALEQTLCDELDGLLPKLTQHLEKMEFRKATDTLRAVWTVGNGYIAKAQPWLQVKENPGQAACTLRVCINLIALYAYLIRPFMPRSSDALAQALELPLPDAYWPTRPARELLDSLPIGHHFSVPPALFSKISADQVATLTEKYGAA